MANDTTDITDTGLERQLGARARAYRSMARSTRPSRTKLGKFARKFYRLSAFVLRQRLEDTPAAGTLARTWGFQLWRRVARRPVLISCAEGSRLIAPSWSRASAIIAGTGLTERDDALFLLDLLRPGDLLADVGANIGFYTVLAARRGARVEAFEPSAGAAATCEQVIALNALGSLATLHRAACGAVSGFARFTTGLDISNHIVRGEESGIEVPVTTLDETLAGLEAPLCVLKVDAEGHDLEVLRGAQQTIARLRPVILVEIWAGGAPKLELVAGLGYRPYSYESSVRTLTEVAPGYRQGGNMLMVADARIAMVRERVAVAKRPQLRPPTIRWRGWQRAAGATTSAGEAAVT